MIVLREDFSFDRAGVEDVGLVPLKERVFWAPLEAGPLERRARRVGGMFGDRFKVFLFSSCFEGGLCGVDWEFVVELRDLSMTMLKWIEV